MMDALEQIAQGLDHGTRVFIIRGAAGTGKTTLIRSLCPYLKQRGMHVHLMAPTGRAALMLRQRTGQAASTIHSGIFNIKDRPIEDNNGNALKWIFPLSHEVDIEDSAFIIDESSMVGLTKHENDRELLQFGSGSLLGDLVEYAGLKTRNTNNVLFFVGDPFQLPPVGERCECPPALDVSILEKLTGMRPKAIELSEVYRQSANSGILAEATKLRAALSAGDFNYFRLSAHSDVHLIQESDMVSRFGAGENLDDMIMISYTNQKARQYNSMIRMVLGHTTVLPNVGERLINIRNTNQFTTSGNLACFYNGDFLTVLNIGDESFEFSGFYKPKNSTKTYEYHFTFRKMSLRWTYEPDRPIVQDSWVNVSPLVTDEWDGAESYASIALYNGVKKLVEDELRCQYHEFRKDPGKKRFWDEMVLGKIKASPFYRTPIVRFGYAITGHKSQGGEWKHVFADYSAATSASSSLYFRWAYTVTTRAKEHLYAACVPKLDSIAQVFGATCIPTTEASNHSTSLDTILQSLGYTASPVLELSYRHRVPICKIVSGIMVTGHIDIVYNGKNIIKSINVVLSKTDEDLTAQLQSFVGKGLSELFAASEVAAPTTPNVVEINVNPIYRGVIDKMVEKLVAAHLPLRSIKALPQNPYQIRFSFSNGYFEVFFNGKGRLTSCGGHTIPENDWNTTLVVLRNSQ